MRYTRYTNLQTGLALAASGSNVEDIYLEYELPERVVVLVGAPAAAGATLAPIGISISNANLDGNEIAVTPVGLAAPGNIRSGGVAANSQVIVLERPILPDLHLVISNALAVATTYSIWLMVSMEMTA